MEAGIIAIVILVAFRIIAGLNIPILSVILRTWWNLSFTIAAYIPFCGWMSHLIITKGDPDMEKEKQKIVEIGEQTDSATADMLEESAKRAKAEQEAYEAQRQQQEEARRAAEDELNAAAYKKYGERNVTLNSDGSMAKVGNSDFVSTEEVKKNLQ